MLPRLCSIVLGLAVCARFSEPAPLALPAGHSLTVVARGLEGARNLRAGDDGLLLADSPDPALRYEIHPARGPEPAAVLLAAPALRSSARGHRFTAARNPLQLRWDAQAAQLTIAAPSIDMAPVVSSAPRGERIARQFNTQQDLSAVALPDGTVFVVDAAARVVYRVAPRSAT